MVEEKKELFAEGSEETEKDRDRNARQICLWNQ